MERRDASLAVRLTDLDGEHDLRLRDIHYLNRVASGDPWFHNRDIDYKVTVAGNGFVNVRDEGSEQGLVAGAFLGERHEHMAGTVKRTDMVGAFGGTR